MPPFEFPFPNLIKSIYIHMSCHGFFLVGHKEFVGPLITDCTSARQGTWLRNSWVWSSIQAPWTCCKTVSIKGSSKNKSLSKMVPWMYPDGDICHNLHNRMLCNSSPPRSPKHDRDVPLEPKEGIHDLGIPFPWPWLFTQSISFGCLSDWPMASDGLLTTTVKIIAELKRKRLKICLEF
jgi:hypothetical protein